MSIRKAHGEFPSCSPGPPLAYFAITPVQSTRKTHRTRTSITSLSLRIFMMTGNASLHICMLPSGLAIHSCVGPLFCSARYYRSFAWLIMGKSLEEKTQYALTITREIISVHLSGQMRLQDLLYDRGVPTEKVEILQVASPHHTPLTGSTNPWNRGTGVVG